MSVDQARQYDHVSRVDGFGGGRIYLRRDRGNAVAFDEDIAARQVAKVAIHRDDGGAFHQDAIHIHDDASSVRRGAIFSVERFCRPEFAMLETMSDAEYVSEARQIRLDTTTCQKGEQVERICQRCLSLPGPLIREKLRALIELS